MSVPASVFGGTWTLSFAKSPTATATINVVPSAPIALTVPPTYVGTVIPVGGSGFLKDETVTFTISPTTFVRVQDGSPTDTDPAIGAISAIVELKDTPYGDRMISVTHTRGKTEGHSALGKVRVSPKVTHVDGLNRDRSGAPTFEQVTKRLGDGLTIVGTGQRANSMLKLWLDKSKDGNLQEDLDIQLETRGATTNANGSYNITADLTSVNVLDLISKYNVFLVDPVAEDSTEDSDVPLVTVLPVQVKFDSSFVRPIASHTTSVKSKDGNIWIQGIAYNQNGQVQPGKNLGYLLLDGTQQNLGGDDAADMFQEGGLYDQDSSPGGFRIQIPTPELTNGLHSLSLAGQTVSFTVKERADGVNISLPIGDSHKVSVYGFGASESIQVKMAGSVVRTASTNANGTAKDIEFTIPDNITGGDYDVAVESASAKIASALKITVLPSIAFKSDSGESDAAHGNTQTPVTVLGKGFHANEGVAFSLGGYDVGVVVTASANGTFEQELTVPSASFHRGRR